MSALRTTPLLMVALLGCRPIPELAGDWLLTAELEGRDCVFVEEDGETVIEELVTYETQLDILGVEQSFETLEAEWRSTEDQIGTSSSQVRLSWTMEGLVEPRQKGDRVEFFVNWLDDTRSDCAMQERYWGTVTDGEFTGDVQSVSGSCTPCATWLGTFSGWVDAPEPGL